MRLDDENILPGGILGGIGDDLEAPVNASGVLAHDFGPDGAGAVLLSGAELPAGFTYALNAEGTQLTVLQNGTPVLLVALSDTVSGAYSVTQLAAIHHPAGGDENDVQFTINYLVTDSTGDSVEGAFGINVDDDAPTATNHATQSVAEGGTVTGTLDFVAGADGATVTHINGTALVFNAADSNYSQAIDIGDGLIKVKADGSYSFTADDPCHPGTATLRRSR